MTRAEAIRKIDELKKKDPEIFWYRDFIIKKEDDPEDYVRVCIRKNSGKFYIDDHTMSMESYKCLKWDEDMEYEDCLNRLEKAGFIRG